MSESKSHEGKSLIIVGTHGEEDPERATMAFACASAAGAIGIDAKIFLTGDGVKLARKNYAEKVKPVEGMAPLKDLIDSFVDGGGKIQVCIPCLESRGIDKTDFLDGVEFINLADFAAETMRTDKVFTC